jgi:hypothetical protein
MPEPVNLTPRAVTATRWLNYAAGGWAILFASPHVWWALGIPAGFPGGEANHRLLVTTPWRYAFDVVVVLLCAIAVVVALGLLRSQESTVSRKLLRTAAWIACGMLSLRGVAGMVADGTSDLIWWPTFLLGGVLFGAVAWFARTRPRSAA